MYKLFRQWFVTLSNQSNEFYLVLWEPNSNQGFLKVGKGRKAEKKEPLTTIIDNQKIVDFLASYMFLVDQELKPARFYHFCTVIDINRRSINFVWNGKLLHDDLVQLNDLQ